MRNDRGTLKVRTETEAPKTGSGITHFPLGPFTVQCTPNAYEHYTRYTLFANGVPIRDQISYPEVEDGWQGLAFARANHVLDEEQLAKLKDFRQAHRQV